MADVVQNSYVETQQHSAVIYQRGKDVGDWELNEAQDIGRIMLYRSFKEGNVYPHDDQLAVSSDNGYKPVGTGAANQVDIQLGRVWFDGVPVPKAATTQLGGFTTNAAGDPRYDIVYAAVTEVEIADPHMVAQLGETSRRRQIQVTLGIATGTAAASPVDPAIPADSSAEIWEGGTRYFKLARVLRPAGASVISAGQVTDLRVLSTPQLLSQTMDHVPSTVYVATRYGLIGDGVFVNDTALSNLEVLIQTNGGGIIFWPPGTYRFTTTVGKQYLVDWKAVPYTVRIAIDHATNVLMDFVFSTPSTRECTIEGIHFSAINTAHASQLVRVPTGNPALAVFKKCKFGDGSLVQGTLLDMGAIGANVTLEDCELFQQQFTSGVLMTSGRLVIRGGKHVAHASQNAPGYTLSGSTVVLQMDSMDVNWDAHLSGTAHVFSMSSGAKLLTNNNIFHTEFSSSAIFTWSSSDCFIHSDDDLRMNVFSGSPPCLARDSWIELDTVFGSSVAGGTTTITANFKTSTMKMTGTSPTFDFPSPKFIGQAHNFIVHNGTGSSLGFSMGNYGFKDTQPTVVTAQCVSGQFVVADPALTGTPVWVQVGGWSLVTV